MATHLLSWLIVVMVIGTARATSGRNTVNSSTCRCTVMNQPCEVQDWTFNHELPKNDNYPGPPRHASAMPRPYSEGSQEGLYWVFSWTAPEGSGLGATTGFYIDLVISLHQRLYIPVSVNDLPSKNSNEVKWIVNCTGDIIDEKSLNVVIGTLPLPPDGTTKTKSILVELPKNDNNPVTWEPAIVMTKYEHSYNIEFTVPNMFLTVIEKFYFWLNGKPLTSEKIEDGVVSKTIHVEEGQCVTSCCNITIQKRCFPTPCGSPLFCGRSCDRPDQIHRNFSLGSGEDDACSPNFTAPQTTATTQFAFVPPATTGLPDDHSSFNQPQPLKDKEGNYAMVVAMVTVTILLIISVMLLTLICKNRQRVKDYCPLQRRPCIEKEVTKEVLPYVTSPMERPWPPSHETEQGELEERPFDYRPRVFLVYSDDHPAHLQVIHMFATFLQDLCGCDVIFDEWSKAEMMYDIQAWYLRELQQADKIIFIQSEGSYRKYHAHLKKQTLIDIQPTPKGDTFRRILPMLLSTFFSESKSDNRYIMARFSYTPTKFLIQEIITGFRYNIPDHLETLVLHLHDSSKYECGKIHHIPFINSTEYHTKPEGSKLQRALDKARQYTEENPDWFSDRYKDQTLYVESQQPNNINNEDCVSEVSSIINDNPLNLIPPSDLTSSDDLPTFMTQHTHGERFKEHPDSLQGPESDEDDLEDQKDSEPSPHGLQYIGSDPKENSFFDSGISSLNFMRHGSGREERSPLDPEENIDDQFIAPESLPSDTSSLEGEDTYFPDYIDQTQRIFKLYSVDPANNVQGANDLCSSSV